MADIIAQVSGRPPRITKFERKENDGTFGALGAITLEHWPVFKDQAGSESPRRLSVLVVDPIPSEKLENE